MEVMTYLLFCALVTLFQQGLGKTMKTLKDISPNNSIFIQKPNTAPSVVMINLNEAPRSKTSMRIIPSDLDCEKCKLCMEKALIEHKQEKSLLFDSANTRYDVLTNEITRAKRDITIHEPIETRKEKKHRSKKNKVPKTVTVTKYTIDGVVSVLKVKENYTPIDSQSSKTNCEVYNVTRFFTCDSPEGELTINLAKTKSSKKGRKEKVLATTTEISTTSLSPSYRKREVSTDIDHQLPDIMSSLEEW